MSTWLKPQDYKLPDVPSDTNGVTWADFRLAYDVRSFLMNASYNLNSGDPQYASPQAYLENMILFAVSLTQNIFTTKYAPPSWSPVAAGFRAAYSCFDMLKQLPVNIGDPNTVSVYDAWVAGKGALYGGHDPVSAAHVTTGDGMNTATGPGAVQGGTIFGGTQR